jgi:aldehyde:ferredoxin oxidoreductase
MEQRQGGYWGRILRIDLGSGSHRSVEPEPQVYRRYIGGRTLALYFYLREVEAGADPLGPENKLIFMTSPITGTPISGQARHTALCKSPLTGGLADSQSGGYWGTELKFAGWDGLIVEGASPRPVYVHVEDDAVQVLPADHLWGKTTGEVQEILIAAHGERARVLQCGPAGERGVLFSALTSDLRNFNARGGIGAVMGSKRLRAIVLKGSHRKLRLADPEGLKRVASWFAGSVKTHPAVSLHHELGTPKGVVPVSVQGILPTYNFQDGSFAAAEAVSGETMKREIGAGTETCWGCAVSCKRVVEGEKGGFRVTRRYGGPEYESLVAFGPNLGVDNIAAVAQCNERCNALGLDTISAGVTIAWAVECFERGILTEADTGGIALKWNDPATTLRLLDLIAARKGFGDLLAQGSRRAARIIGRGAEDYAMQVKGQELPSHEPRGKWGVALGYAVSPTGADHLQAAHDPWFTKPGDFTKEFNWVDLEDLSPLGITDPVPAEDLSPAKVRLFVYLQYVWALHDVLDWCIFTSVPEFRAISLNQLVEVVRSVTGWRTSLFELLKAGERAITMARTFNCSEGLTAADDRIPERFFEPMRGGTLKGHRIDREAFDQALKLYYGMMGWDSDGTPTPAKLEELGVGWLCKRLGRS